VADNIEGVKTANSERMGSMGCGGGSAQQRGGLAGVHGRLGVLGEVGEAGDEDENFCWLERASLGFGDIGFDSDLLYCVFYAAALISSNTIGLNCQCSAVLFTRDDRRNCRVKVSLAS